MKKTSLGLFPLTFCEVVWKHVRAMVRETPASVEDYSEDVLRVWLATTPEDARHHDLDSRAPKPFERMKANGQKIRRWMNPEIPARPSADLVPALVLALPEPYRDQCMAELAMMFGGMFVPLPDGEVSISIVGELLSAVGETCRNLGAVIADNQINECDDHEQLLELRASLAAVQAKVAGILVQVDTALERQSEAAPRAKSGRGTLRAVR